MKEGRLPVEMGKLYHQLFAARQSGDYGGPTDFELEAVEAWLTEAQAFVDRIAAEIDTAPL